MANELEESVRHASGADLVDHRLGVAAVEPRGEVNGGDFGFDVGHGVVQVRRGR